MLFEGSSPFHDFARLPLSDVWQLPDRSDRIAAKKDEGKFRRNDIFIVGCKGSLLSRLKDHLLIIFKIVIKYVLLQWWEFGTLFSILFWNWKLKVWNLFTFCDCKDKTRNAFVSLDRFCVFLLSERSSFGLSFEANVVRRQRRRRKSSSDDSPQKFGEIFLADFFLTIYW